MRPAPPPEVLAVDAWGAFTPGLELGQWIRATLIDADGQLHNPDHAHLGEANIGYLWTSAPCIKKGRTVVGMAELPKVGGNDWQKARKAQQLREWFGDIPDFVVTLDAYYCRDCSDEEFLALVEHELYHCAQGVDEFGTPRFNKDDGRPAYEIRGHDVEEFVGVVRRYGPISPEVQDLVIAAAQRPEVARLNIARACGTCALKSA